MVVGVYGNEAPISAARFLQLAGGVQGLGYRRTLIDLIETEEEDDGGAPIYIRNGGINAFVIPGSATPVDIVGGSTAAPQLTELAASRLRHTNRGDVSMVVNRDGPPPEPVTRLVSIQGKFEMVTDPIRPGPNGTAWCVTIAAGENAELDATNIVIGRVLQGMDVVDVIARLPTVRFDTSHTHKHKHKNSPHLTSPSTTPRVHRLRIIQTRLFLPWRRTSAINEPVWRKNRLGNPSRKYPC